VNFLRRSIAPAAILFAAATAGAQVTTYSSQSALGASVGPLTVENFTSGLHYPLGSTLNSASSYAATGIAPGDIQAGVTYSVSDGPLLIDGGGGFTGGFLDGLRGWGTVGPLTATFDAAVRGFGFATNYLMGSAFTVTLNYTGGASETSTFALTNAGTEFFGFSRETADIVSASIEGNSDTFNFAVDDFAFSSVNEMPVTTTPEPGTWVLMGTGLLALGGVQVRRKRSTR
jgi:hypothetical protein